MSIISDYHNGEDYLKCESNYKYFFPFHFNPPPIQITAVSCTNTRRRRKLNYLAVIHYNMTILQSKDLLSESENMCSLGFIAYLSKCIPSQPCQRVCLRMWYRSFHISAKMPTTQNPQPAGIYHHIGVQLIRIVCNRNFTFVQVYGCYTDIFHRETS